VDANKKAKQKEAPGYKLSNLCRSQIHPCYLLPGSRKQSNGVSLFCQVDIFQEFPPKWMFACCEASAPLRLWPVER
jgi:hypothetical protein